MSFPRRREVRGVRCNLQVESIFILVGDRKLIELHVDVRCLFKKKKAPYLRNWLKPPESVCVCLYNELILLAFLNVSHPHIVSVDVQHWCTVYIHWRHLTVVWCDMNCHHMWEHLVFLHDSARSSQLSGSSGCHPDFNESVSTGQAISLYFAVLWIMDWRSTGLLYQRWRYIMTGMTCAGSVILNQWDLTLSSCHLSGQLVIMKQSSAAAAMHWSCCLSWSSFAVSHTYLGAKFQSSSCVWLFPYHRRNLQYHHRAWNILRFTLQTWLVTQIVRAELLLSSRHG